MLVVLGSRLIRYKAVYNLAVGCSLAAGVCLAVAHKLSGSFPELVERIKRPLGKRLLIENGNIYSLDREIWVSLENQGRYSGKTQRRARKSSRATAQRP